MDLNNAILLLSVVVVVLIVNAIIIIMKIFSPLFRVLSTCHDKPSRFVYIMTRGTREFLVPEDFIPLVQDVVDTHPGLTFLKEAAEFHSRYVHTVSTVCFH
jgi:serine/threonine-protein phosphatase 2A regulatory subunit B''